MESYSNVFVAENGSLTETEKVSLSFSILCLKPIPVKNINGLLDCRLISPPKRYESNDMVAFFQRAAEALIPPLKLNPSFSKLKSTELTVVYATAPLTFRFNFSPALYE